MTDVQRRQHPRIDIRLSAEIQREDGLFTAVTKNLSAGGAALEAERPLVEGETIRLSLFLVVDGIEDATTPPLVVGARVIWAAEGDDGTHTAGVKFETITPAQVEWLRKFLQVTDTAA